MAITQFTNIGYSDALPIQLWPADCDTWNESSPEGVYHKDFCQPVQCDDLLRIEFTDVLTDDANYIAVTLPVLSAWKTRSTSASKTDWTTGAAPSVALPSSANILGADSEILYFDTYTFLPGFKYQVTISYTGNANGTITIASYDSSFNVIDSQLGLIISGSRTLTLYFTATSDTAIFGVVAHTAQFNALTCTINTRSGLISTPDAYQMTIVDESEAILQVVDLVSITITGSETSLAFYSKSFRFSDYGICDEKVQIKIYKSTGTPDIEVLKSDGLDVKTTHAETVLITYSNHRNYGGIYYSSVSPDQEFSIRIPAIFFKKRFPQTQETLQLSSNRVIALNAQMKFQQLLSTGKMPLYMHLKMTLVLAHQNISINDESWVNEEGYQQIEATDKRDPFEMYTAWLTKKEYIVRNIL